MGAGSQEIQGIKNTLQLIEENNLFARDARRHRVRRQDKDELDIEDDQDIMMEAVAEEQVAPEDESRGWKNGGGKKKKNKKNKEAAVATESILEAAEATEVAMKENSSPQANSLETKEDAMKGMVEDKDPFTSGIQFSAYSGGGAEARPTYKPARAAAAAASRPAATAAGPENRFMYGLDRNGNPQFMDEAAVSMLLQNPQAKKVKQMFWINATKFINGIYCRGPPFSCYLIWLYPLPSLHCTENPIYVFPE
jgi:hypothetical protein